MNRRGPETVTIATLNIHSLRQEWPRRAPVILDQLRAEPPDVLLLQEAARWAPQPAWLAWRLSRATGRRYRAFTVPKRGWWWFVEGLAMVTSLPVTEHARLNLRGNERVAQRLTVQTPGGVLFDAYNLHLAHRGNDERLRNAQVRRLLAWMDTRPGVPAVVGGDFNAGPESETVRLMLERTRSAHTVAHGGEPPFTAPSHAAPGMGRTIDYLFATEGARVADCDVAFGPVERGGRRVFPSDHLGLMGRFVLEG